MDKRYTENIEDTEVYLKDLIFYLAKRWKSLIAVILIGALLGGGFSAVSSMRRTAEVSPEEFTESYEVDETLAEEMELAAQYRVLYYRQKDYMQNSILMQMDPNAYYEGTLTLYLSAGPDTEKVSAIYQSLAYDPSLYDDCAAASGYNGDSAYLREAIHISSMNFDNDPYTVSLSDSEEDQLTFTVLAVDEKSCRNMLSVVLDYIKKTEDELAGEYKDYNSDVILSEVNVKSSGYYLTEQELQMENLNTYYSKMTALEADFTGDDLEYYKEEYLSNDLETETPETEEPEEIEETEAVIEPEGSDGTSIHISMRWIILGVIAMVVLWGIVLVIRYLMDESIKTNEEIKETYRLPVLGRIGGENAGKGIDKWVNSLYERTKEPADTVSYIASVINAMPASGIALCGDQNDEYTNSLMEKLRQSANQVECMPFISKEDQSLKRATELGKEILIVQIGSTTRTEMIREMELCELQNIEILGVIVIDNV